MQCSNVKSAVWTGDLSISVCSVRAQCDCAVCSVWMESGGGSVKSVRVQCQESVGVVFTCNVYCLHCAVCSSVWRVCGWWRGCAMHTVHAVFTDFSPLFSVQCLDSRECSMFSVQSQCAAVSRECAAGGGK